MVSQISTTAEITEIVDQLMEAVHALLGMAGQQTENGHQVPSQANTFQADMRRYHSHGEFVDLSSVEASILATLLQSRGRLVPKNELCNVLGLEPRTQDHNLKSYVHRLRKKLRRLENPGVKIQPIHGAGYILTEVSEQASA